VAYTEARLNRWGRWLKRRRPRIGIERIDAEMITRYIANCSSFRAKTTVYATLSTMRGFGDYQPASAWPSGSLFLKVSRKFLIPRWLQD
jgi:hypothetical protein